MNHLITLVRSWTVRHYRRARRYRSSRISQVVHVFGREDLPGHLHPQRLYLLGGVTPKWALLDCPCGRGHVIELNLANAARARWRVTTDESGQPSVHPSINFQGELRCHYWVDRGRVQWARDRRAH